MIVKFKPMSRIAAAASAVVLAAVAWVTLTGAADRPVPPQGAEASPSPAPTQPAETTARVIDLMRVELARLDAQIDQKQAQMDRLREQLRIAALEEAGTPDPEPLRRMESLRAEQATEHQKLSSLYTGLTNMPRPELLRAISTESPDQLLTALLEQRANVEARYAEAVEAYGSDHPEVKRSRRALDQIQLQIDGRLTGIMEGLKVRAKTAEHSAALLAKEVQQLRKAQIDQAIESRPYFRAKRELDNLESVYDDLHKRLMQAQIEAAIAPSAERK